MGKRRVFLGIVSLAMALLFAGTALAAEKTYEFKVSHLSSTSNPIHDGYVFLKNTLEEKSKGRIKVTLYPNKQISNSDNENAEKVQLNIIQMCSVPSSSVASIANVPEYKVFDYAYLFDTTDEMYKVIDSELGAEMADKVLKKTGIKAVSGYHIGWSGISSNKQPINSPADLKGQKIRTMASDLVMESVRAFGANPVVVNFGELFTACQQGTVDGIVTIPGLFLSERFYEVQKYLGCTNPMPIFHIPLVNAKWYNALPDDLKKAFDESIPLFLEATRTYHLDYEANALDELRKRGMVVTEYTPEQRKVFVDAASYIVKDKADIVGKEFMDKVLAKLGR